MLAPFLTLTLALSSSGNRLVVISEDAAEQKKFSKLFGDLKGELAELIDEKAIAHILRSDRGFLLSFESPKSDKLNLFKHGEREYDHVLLFPPKSKGKLSHGKADTTS